MPATPKPPVNRWKFRKLGGRSVVLIGASDPGAAIERLTRTGKQTADAFRRDDIGALRRIEKTKGR